MKSLRSVRYALLLSLVTALVSLAFAAGTLQAASLSVHGSTGQALALRASLRALTPLAKHAKTFRDIGVPQDLRRGSDGRFVYNRQSLLRAGAILKDRAVGNTPVVDEAVQTFDVFNPPPAFTPTQGLSLTPSNLYPIWTADETMLIFSSNRTASGGVQADGSYHIWAIPVNGGTPIQLTSSALGTGASTTVRHGEFFPTLSAGNNSQIAFTSDAQTPNVQNLFSIPFTSSTVNVNTLTALQNAPTIRTNDPLSIAQGGLGFSNVQRPAFSPANSDLIVFSALSTAGSNAGHYHLYYLYLSTGGYTQAQASLPAKITDGQGDDFDPAFSQDGQLIAFSSTATVLAATAPANLGPNSSPNASLVTTGSAGINHNIFLLGGGVNYGFAAIENSGAPITAVGTDNTGPAWSSLRRNAYINPAPGAEYIAFARGASPTVAHDIFYLQVLQNTDAGGESGRSNEAATTALPAATPIYQVNAGGTAGLTLTNGTNSYVGDQAFTTNAGSIFVNGGTADNTNPPPVTNTTGDPGTPPGIYLSDRSGTFTYTFSNLTPNATYTVRLHLSDPKNTAAGKRIFKVTANGNDSPPIDIVALAQSQPPVNEGVQGLVVDNSSGAATPIAGATITITTTAGNAVATTPSPLLTSATTSSDLTGGPVPINYSNLLAQGSYIVTVTPPSGSGYSPESQLITVNSGAYTRADFNLTPGTGTLTGSVTAASVGIPGAVITVTDPATGAAVATAPSSIKTDGNGAINGTKPVTLPVGTYNVTVTPPAGSGYTTQTQPVTITAGTATNVPFVLQSTTNTGVGTLAGLVSNSVTPTVPLAGATITVKNAGGATVALLTSAAATTSPTAPNGDGNPVNYSANLPTGTYTVLITQPGYVSQTKSVAVVNTAATATAAAIAFVRDDAPLVSSAPTAGQNTAYVYSFNVTVSSNDITDKNGLVTTPRGSITLAFSPEPNGGDPPIVQGVEITTPVTQSSDPTTKFASGFGYLAATTNSGFNFTTNVPSLNSALGVGLTTTTNGVTTTVPAITLNFFSQFSNSFPSAYNIYRSPGLPGSVNTPPASGAGTEGTVPYATILGNNFSFTDTGVTPGTEYYYQVTAVYKQNINAEGTGNPAIQLNTDDNAGETIANGTAVSTNPGNVFNDEYPTWSPFRSIYSIAYSSNRTVTYTSPATGNPSETAISIGQGSGLNAAGTAAVSKTYSGILESQVVNLDPPTLVPYSGTEIVHVADASGTATRTGIQPGQSATFTVRLSSREAGVDDNNIYLQIKNPNSKYQDAQNLEHKVFAKDAQYRYQANNPRGIDMDSGSSTLLMYGGSPNTGFSPDGIHTFYNYFGGGNSTFSNADNSYAGFNSFSINGLNVFYGQRGVVGGIDGPESRLGGGAMPGPAANKSDTISVGQDGGGVNSQGVFDGNGKPVLDANKNPVTLPGGDPNLFVPWGPEFECQVVNPLFAGGDTAPTDFRDPYWLAGVDDQQPFSGIKSAPSTTGTTTTFTSLRPSTEWLKMKRIADDGQGGVLYSVTWTTPASPSDYYLDVVAFDKATAPFFSASSGSNWRIYDNVWGFSTNQSIGNNDILVVSDYALGQKFAATTFGGQRGLVNLVPKLYGAESYVTDVDVNILPNATYRWAVFPGANGNNPQAEVLDFLTEYAPLGQTQGTAAAGPIFQVENGLGVGSYYDRFIDDGVVRDGRPGVHSQLYSIWRTLSRGPVPASAYKYYGPSKPELQPAVNDPLAPTKVNVAAGNVPVANRCILWISPFTGDVLAGPGTLADPATQASLRAFVAGGGRLCVSGQDVASTLTQNGNGNNSAGGFVYDVLNAKLATVNGGTHIPSVGATPSNADNRITNIPSYDGELQGGYQEIQPDGTQQTTSPSQRPIIISNNYNSNIFEAAYRRTAAYSGNWRQDGSLDNLGPYIQGFPEQGNNTNSVVSRLNTITPNANAHVDITLAPFTNPIPRVDNGDVNAATEPGGVGLIYTENPVGGTTTGSNGSGSKVVFATFGLEALSIDYYKQTSSFKPNPIFYVPRNQRPAILHNIVSYLRTGSITGTVRATSGNGQGGSGIPGVTVYVLSAYGAPIPGRGTFSATTDSNGNYSIDGVEPGNYTLAAYRSGYTRATSNTGTVITIEGDTRQVANLTMSAGTSGSIAGTVKDSKGVPVAGASVVFNSPDGLTFSATTDSNGSYSLPVVPPDTYTGQASAAGYSTATSAAITVTGGATSTVPFVLQAGPGTVTGRVLDPSGNPLAGATVYASSGSPATVAATFTTNASGVYTGTLTGGTYTLTATATGFGTSSPIQAVITGGATTTEPDLQLGTIQNGTLGGLVTGASNTTPVAGVTLTITNTGTGQAVTPAPVSAASSSTGADGNAINYGPVSLAAGTYTVAASKNGVSAGTQTVSIVANTFSRLDFTGVSGLPALHTFLAGLNFLSVPYDYSGTSFDAIFGTVNTAPTGTTPNGTRSRVAVWDPTAGAYALDPTAPADALRLGVGYWVYLKNPVVLSQPGAAPTGSVSVALHPSWNQIGVPSTSGVLVSKLLFQTGTNTLSFATATSSSTHVVSPTLYRFDGSAYQPVVSTDTLQPYTAYWIKVYVGTTLLIPTGN